MLSGGHYYWSVQKKRKIYKALKKTNDQLMTHLRWTSGIVGLGRFAGHVMSVVGHVIGFSNQLFWPCRRKKVQQKNNLSASYLAKQELFYTIGN